MEQEFSNRIKYYNFILCLLVILIHAENSGIFLEHVEMLNTIEYIVVEKFARLAIAGFFLCSGYLFYRNFTMDKLGAKWKSRFFSTVIPFGVWNLLYFLLHYVLTKVPVLSGIFGNKAIPFNLREILEALLFYKYNPVFWFLQFLIVFIYICPLIYLIIRNRWTGLAGIIILYFVASSQCLDAYSGTASAMANWLFIYMAGAYIGRHWRQTIEEGLHQKAIAAVLCICSVLSFIMLQQHPSLYWTLLYYLSGAMLIWYLLCLIRLPQAREWMGNTFYIYAVHFMIIQFGNKVVHKMAGDSMYIGMLLFVVLPVVVVVFCYYTSRFMARYTPGIWKILSGNR